MKKVALIGAGGVVFGKHTEAYAALSERMQPWVVCDPSIEGSLKMREWAKIPDARYVQDLSGLDAFRDEVDLAVVATPVKYHQAAVEYALGLGWDVLCEKPLAMSIEEVDSMIDCAEAGQRRLGVIHNIYFMSEVRDTNAFIRNGHIGEVKFVQGHSHSQPWSGKEWRSDASMGGKGHFFDCLYHEIYCARSCIGSPISRVHAVEARLGQVPISVEDMLLCTMEFENGALASFQDVKAFPELAPAVFAAYGTEGAVIRTIPSADRLYVYRGKERSELPVDPESSEEGTLGVFSRFIDAMESGGPLPYEIDAAGDGRENLRVIYAAYESAATGNPVDMRTWRIRR